MLHGWNDLVSDLGGRGGGPRATDVHYMPG